MQKHIGDRNNKTVCVSSTLRCRKKPNQNTQAVCVRPAQSKQDQNTQDSMCEACRDQERNKTIIHKTACVWALHRKQRRNQGTLQRGSVSYTETGEESRAVLTRTVCVGTGLIPHSQINWFVQDLGIPELCMGGQREFLGGLKSGRSFWGDRNEITSATCNF